MCTTGILPVCCFFCFRAKKKKKKKKKKQKKNRGQDALGTQGRDALATKLAAFLLTFPEGYSDE